jgi:hypothetical protein
MYEVNSRKLPTHNILARQALFKPRFLLFKKRTQCVHKFNDQIERQHREDAVGEIEVFGQEGPVAGTV